MESDWRRKFQSTLDGATTTPPSGDVCARPPPAHEGVVMSTKGWAAWKRYESMNGD